MATETMSLGDFEQTIESNDIVLIDFWASWCGPCRMFGPIFEEASEKHPDIVFAKVNTEEERDLAATFGIRSIPTLAIFREGVAIFRQPGMVPGDVLDELIQKVRDLDMDEVRADIAAQTSAAAPG